MHKRKLQALAVLKQRTRLPCAVTEHAVENMESLGRTLPAMSKVLWLKTIISHMWISMNGLVSVKWRPLALRAKLHQGSFKIFAVKK